MISQLRHPMFRDQESRIKLRLQVQSPILKSQISLIFLPRKRQQIENVRFDLTKMIRDTTPTAQLAQDEESRALSRALDCHLSIKRETHRRTQRMSLNQQSTKPHRNTLSPKSLRSPICIPWERTELKHLWKKKWARRIILLEISKPGSKNV